MAESCSGITGTALFIFNNRMNENVMITKVETKDAALLAMFAKETFSDAYGAMSRKEDMEAYTRSHFTEEAILAEMLEAHTTFYQLLKDDKRAAYMKIIEQPEDHMIFVDRFYVHKNFQGMGLGTEMMSWLKEWAKSHGYKELMLQVWEKNLLSLDFYQKKGFVKDGATVFKLGEDLQKDYIMKLVLI